MFLTHQTPLQILSELELQRSKKSDNRWSFDPVRNRENESVRYMLQNQKLYGGL